MPVEMFRTVDGAGILTFRCPCGVCDHEWRVSTDNANRLTALLQVQLGRVGKPVGLDVDRVPRDVDWTAPLDDAALRELVARMLAAGAYLQPPP